MTDTTETGRRPCRCGKGEIVDYRETPDHGWASGQWVRNSSTIECPECAATYLLSGDGFILRSDYEARDRERRAVWKQEQAFLGSPGVIAIFRRLAARLDQEASMAATHRLLTHHGLTLDSLNTFRKKWRGGEHWIGQHKSSHLLERLREGGAITKEKHPDVIDGMDRLKALSDAANRPLTVIA